MTNDGAQLVLVDSTNDEVWTLDDIAKPASAANRGTLPAPLDVPVGITWDGTQLVILDTGGDEIWTLASASPQPTALIGSLVADTVYYVRVTSRRSNAENAAATDGTATTASANTPTQVTGLAVADTGSVSVGISWTQVSTADSYTVEWATTSGSSNPSTHTVSGGSTLTYTITGLSESTTYYISVFAKLSGER